MKRALTILVGWGIGLAPVSPAQTPSLGVPSITATAKGPNQINLSWPAVSNPGYGYLIEIQSDGDSRYSDWQELKPIPTATGYTCDNTILIRGAFCNISDPSGVHVYNAPGNGVPYWVTDSTYIDPQDGSAAQFIASGLNPNTSYSFRVRTYSGNTSLTYGDYSPTTAATTPNYTRRFVSPSGNDSNDGTDDFHSWRTLSRAASAIRCGQVLIVKGGNYPNDKIVMSQACSPGNKAVVLVNPGETASIASVPDGVDHTISLAGSYLVIDGLTSASSSTQNGDYDIAVDGHHNAIFNVETHPVAIPTFKGGVTMHGDHNLLYRSYLHDAFSPDATQNPNGNGGFVLTLEGAGATANVIWSNHLTRGGHDVSLCIRGCSHNRWLNNIMDGGWGMGWEAIQGSQHNLVEGNIIKDVGQLVTFYKPSIEVSEAYNTIRRNIAINGKSAAIEVSALYGGSTVVNSLIYNNIFYKTGSCYFQSHNGGVSAYDNVVFANNICYRFPETAADIYLGNKTNQNMYNAILFIDSKGTPQPNKAIITWNHDGGGSFEYPQTLANVDKSYNPPFLHNKGLDVTPEFVDEENFDFHLTAGSPLIGVGTQIRDPDWGHILGTVDLGAFGIHPAPARPRRPRQPLPRRPR